MKVTGVERGKAYEGYSRVFVSLPSDRIRQKFLLPLVYDYLRQVKGSKVVCISPLTALMMEQKTKYTHQGLVLEFSGELQHDIQSICNVRERLVQLIYVSPESIPRNLQWRDMVLYEEKSYNIIHSHDNITLEMKPLIRIFHIPVSMRS